MTTTAMTRTRTPTRTPTTISVVYVSSSTATADGLVSVIITYNLMLMKFNKEFTIILYYFMIFKETVEKINERYCVVLYLSNITKVKIKLDYVLKKCFSHHSYKM